MKFLLVIGTVLMSIISGSIVNAADSIPAPGRVTLLDIGSDCLPCELQDRIVRRMEKNFAESVSVIYIDVKKNPESKQKFNVDIIPTLIFFDSDGKEVVRRSGYMKENDIRKLLKQLTRK